MLGRLATNLDLKCDLMTRWGRGNFILEFCETKTNVTNRHQSKFMWSSIFPISYFLTKETEQRECSLLKSVGITSCRVVKSSWLPAKIAAYFISIGQLLCLGFLYGSRFLKKISLDWLLTLTTEPENPDLVCLLLLVIG